jgi:hypothetical protein
VVTAALAGPRPWRPSPAAWAAVLGGLLAVSTVATALLSVLAGADFNGLVALMIGVPCGIVGVLVARRQPANPLGWLLLAVAACLIIATAGSDYSLLRYRLGYHLPLGVAAIAVNQLWGPGLELLGLVVLLFPDGRLTSAWWRGALWTYLGLYALGIVLLAVASVTHRALEPAHVTMWIRDGGP